MVSIYPHTPKLTFLSHSVVQGKKSRMARAGFDTGASHLKNQQLYHPTTENLVASGGLL